MKNCFLCVVALLVMGSFVSASDVFTFDYECSSNNACVGPGEEYCGDGQVSKVSCIDDKQCEVTCKPIDSKPADETWDYSAVSVPPADKRVNQPFDIIITDNREGEPLVWDFELYYGGRWEVTEMEGATHYANTMAVVNSFTDTEYVDGQLILSSHVNRQGEYTYTPKKPGRYVLYTVGKYIRFMVGDENGNVFECEDSVCDSDLGEDTRSCPQDCTSSDVAEIPSQPPSPSMPRCGDGTCDVMETYESCPQDCIDSQKIKVGVCGDGNCELNEDETNCPADCKSSTNNSGSPMNVVCGDSVCTSGAENAQSCPSDCAQAPQLTQGGGTDMILIIIVVVVVLVLGLLAFLMKSGKLQLGGAGKPKAITQTKPTTKAQPAETEQPKTNFCPKCGNQLNAGDAFCHKCGNKL